MGKGGRRLWFGLLTLLLAAAVFLVDALLPLDVATGVAYVIAVLVSLETRRRRFTLLTAALCTALVGLGDYVSEPHAERWLALTNRGLAVFAIWVTALLCLWRHGADARRMGQFRDTEERLRMILDYALDAVVTIDEEGRITGWNPQAERTFGWRREAVLGKLLRDTIVPPQHREAYEHGLRRFLSTGESTVLNRRIEWTALRRNGEEFPVELTVTDFRHGRRHYFNAFIRDITHQRKAAEALRRRTEELQRSNRELDQFAHIASHDLRAPLRAIANLARWTADDAGETLAEEPRKNLRTMQQRVRRLEGLLEGLLEYSRAGRVEGTLQRLDTGELTARIVEMLAPPEGFRVQIAENMPTVFSPRPPLEQVILNLIANAIKHHDRTDGLVRVSARDEGDRVAFEIADDGPGIAPEFQARMFQMFQTLRPRDEVEGSGMGLAVVKKVIESYGGSITVESSPGAGAAFRFTWPKQAVREGEAPAEPNVAGPEIVQE